ncbi:UDP-glucosyltransferase 2-like, partial [Drosophila kikkawai]|uniref:UDP-glucosyltransferase 2-like n=1 Tax=Drosophila kikkawai TaxID=30033 RepID=A0ABM4GKM7_DROKI
MKTYLKTLASRGHQVTVINAFANTPTPNIRFIEIPKLIECHEEMKVNFSWDKILPKLVVITLEDDGVQELLKSGETFDLVLVEMELVETLYGLAQHFNASLAGFLSFGTHYTVDEAMGNVSPISYNPLVTSSCTDRMSFTQRLANHYEYLVEKAHRHFIHLPAMQKLYDKYFPEAKQTMSEAINSISLVLLGDHFSLSHSRPYLPNMIEVGGMHISHQPEPLPDDIRQFIEDSPDGVIYFSMGSNMKSTDLSQETLDVLVKTFASLKQRVLWKFEDQLPGKPDNVLIKNWYPQSDILAHPNVKLFISHGGQLSITESVYFGKPFLGLPCFFDQFRNVLRAQKLGFGLGLNVKNLK